MNKNWMVFLMLLTALGLTACNTIQGAGEDIEKGGEVIQKGAKDAKY
ncbi:MAG TPA: entericidin A/B family lipoprotein [Gammaproteobacteria bacterium]|nr:entericidin A/B family lipoprotein [Gammaproteobacteria bacterium]